jgi:1D-myo-inositol 3-kinase
VPPTFAGTFRSGENAGVPCDVLLVGHYTHDLLRFASGDRAELGGSSAYASAVFDAFQIDYRVVAYAGADFRYADRVRHAPRILEGARTTSFVDDYRRGERTATLLAAAPPIDPADLREPCTIAIACGVAREIDAAVLERLRDLSRIMLVDAQAVVRGFGDDGRVVNRAPPSAVASALRRVDWIKCSRDELAALPVSRLEPAPARPPRPGPGSLRNQDDSAHIATAGAPRTAEELFPSQDDSGLIVTEGAQGCVVVQGVSEISVPAFAAREVDPTGAGDCLLAGFALGLLRGWSAVRAARFGAWCGARAVEQHGVPRLTREQLQSFPG